VTDRLPAPERGDTQAAFERASATPTRTIARAAHGPAMKSAKPTSLRETQEWLVRAIADDPEGIDAASVVTPSRSLDAAQRLYVYQSGYLARLVECLRDDYPVLAASMGDEAWETLCREYVERHPSRSPNLNAFGRHMASLLRDLDRAFEADLATLEWALVEIIHAPVPPPLDLGALATMPPEAWAGVTFARSEAVRLLAFDYPVNTFYRRYRETGDVPPRPSPAPSWTVAYRAGGTLWRMDLTQAMNGVLGALLEGAPLGEALAGIDDDDEEAARSVMIWFREWVSGGIFAGVTSH